MMKRILVLVGSARRKGNTEALADAFIEGTKKQGLEVTKYCLAQKTIKPCIDCKYCYQHEGKCVLQDDMHQIYEMMTQTDVIVLASPVYFYNFSSQLKAVFDRLYNPIRNTFPIKEATLLCCYADEGATVCQPMIKTYEAIIDYLG